MIIFKIKSISFREFMYAKQSEAKSPELTDGRTDGQNNLQMFPSILKSRNDVDDDSVPDEPVPVGPAEGADHTPVVKSNLLPVVPRIGPIIHISRCGTTSLMSPYICSYSLVNYFLMRASL